MEFYIEMLLLNGSYFSAAFAQSVLFCSVFSTLDEMERRFRTDADTGLADVPGGKMVEEGS